MAWPSWSATWRGVRPASSRRAATVLLKEWEVTQRPGTLFAVEASPACPGPEGAVLLELIAGSPAGLAFERVEQLAEVS